MNGSRTIGILLLPIMIGSIDPCMAVDKADLVLRNGHVITLDEGNPQAEALAIKGDRILAVGKDPAIEPWIGDRTQVIDLQGHLAIPGFIEAHAHFVGLGESLMELNLHTIRNWDEAITMVQTAVKKAQPGEWIVGRGWHQEKWDRLPQPNVEEYPTYDALSAISPLNPVFLIHASGHMGFANAKAMELAGVDAATPVPSGGEILTDALGNPIGIFRESAQGLIYSAYEKSRDRMTAQEKQAETLHQIDLATAECLSKGITSFQDAGSTFETIDLFKSLAQQDRLLLRLWVMLGESNDTLRDKLDRYRLIGYGDHHLTVRAIKRFMDGALGAHGAWLLKPYNDLPDSAGLNLESPESIRETARMAIAHGFQLCTHAIGDRANREILDIYEGAFQENPDRTDLRWRIEHAQHLHPDEIARFAPLGVIASMQACHCTSDAPYVIERLGAERARDGAYAWRSLLDRGVKIANGTDAPVEDIDPIANFYAAVSRRTQDGTAFFPEQCMTREQALRASTLDAAYAAFEETLKGTLIPGKFADITVLSEDILTVPLERIRTAKVLYTIVGGRIMYREGEGVYGR